MVSGRRLASFTTAALLVLGSLGCNLQNEGEPPQRGDLYFPVALAVSPQEPGQAARFLFVANSNFDLRWNAGSVQALSLERLDQAVRGCSERQCQIDPGSVLEDEVLVGSFATALGTSTDGRYLFVSTRTSESLTYIDLDLAARGDRVLDCGDGRRCFRDAEDGVDPRTGRAARWPTDPVAITTGRVSQWHMEQSDGADVSGAATLDGDKQYAVVAHRDGAVSLFYETPEGGFRFAAAEQITARDVTGIGYDAASGFIYLTRAGGSFKQLYRVGLVFSPIGYGSFPFSAGALSLEGVAPTGDTRAVSFLLQGGQDGALDSAALREERALVVARSPNALLLVDVDEARNRPASATVKRITHIGSGASKLAVGHVRNPNDTAMARRLLAVVSCFNSRQIYVIDLATMEALAVVPNLSGPFDIALDSERALLYVTDFRSSVLRVIDLAPAVSGGTDPVRVLATVGEPRVLQELQ